MDLSRGVSVRSYVDVVDVVERRIFRIDRWRLPTPHGVSIRAVAYAAASFVAVLVAGSLPGVGELLGLLPGSVHYLAFPALAGWALSSLWIDGRSAHHALVAALRHRLRACTLAGLRTAPGIGTTLAPIAAVQIAPTGDDPDYRAGRVRGPAAVTLRYPAEISLEQSWAVGSACGVAGAKRIRVCQLVGRPLVRGHEIRIPAGGEVIFE